MSEEYWYVLVISTLLLLGLLTFLLCAPLLFRHSPRFRDSFLYLTWLNLPPSRWDRLKNPAERYGLPGAHNETLYVAGGQINLWRIEGGGGNEGSIGGSKESLNKNQNGNTSTFTDTVILYCHGNSCNRASRHRRKLYSVLSSHYTVVTFDYRGFGDSPSETHPNEDSVVEDAASVLEWVVEMYPDRPLVLWGHSLGTGVVVKLLTALRESLPDDSLFERADLRGVVLESPFLNAAEAGHTFPASKAYNLLPCTRGLIGESMRGLFPSDSLLPRVKLPVMIIHARDDGVIPVVQGERLGEVGGCETRIYEEGGHVWLCENEGAMGDVRDFIGRVTAAGGGTEGGDEGVAVEEVRVEE